MTKLENTICKHLIKRGLFHSMIKYKKDYQQLSVIFKRHYGKPLKQYLNDNNLENPKIGLTWQEKADLICKTFKQEIIDYTKENRTKYPLTLKCQHCGKTYNKSWDEFNTGAICNCTKVFQRKIVDVNYYIEHYLKSDWTLLNPEEYKNSHSILKLQHKCGHISTGMAKTLKGNKGRCKCEPKKPKKIGNEIFTVEMKENLEMQGLTPRRIRKLYHEIKALEGQVVKIIDGSIIMKTCYGEDTIIFSEFFNGKRKPKRKPIIQKLLDYGLTKTRVNNIKRRSCREKTTLVDIEDNQLIEQLACGCIHKTNLDERLPLKRLCKCKSKKQFYNDLKHYPLQSSFDERWSLIDYSGKTKPITIECKKCKYIRKLNKIDKFKYHVRCKCEDNISYGERMIFNLLNHNSITFETQYTLDNKRFDFYLPEQNLLIEYDGIQHQMDTPWWGILHKDQIANDKLKNKIASKYGHQLIRFTHDSNINDIIRNLKPYLKLKKDKNFDYNKPVTLLPDEIIDNYLTMTFDELIEKYKGQGYAINLVRLNREFKIKYGMTKTEYNSSRKRLPDEIIDDFKVMNIYELRDKYPAVKEKITHYKLKSEFRRKYGMNKLEYRRQFIN